MGVLGNGLDERRPGAAVVRFGLLTVILVIYLRQVLDYDFLADDAFISMRYARNLLEGHGLVFNPGDRVEGYTNFLWVLVLAAAGGLGVDLVTAAQTLGLALGGATVLITFLLARRLVAPDREWLAYVAAALVALSGPFACWALGGLETPLFAALLAGALLLHVQGRVVASAIVCGLSALARPEGALLAVVLLPAVALADRRRALGWVGACAAIVVPFYVWRTWYYGELLPNTFHAKVGWTAQQLERGLGYLWEASSELGGLVVVALGAFAVAQPVRGSGPLLVFVVAMLAYVGVVGGDGLPMYRFIAPVVPLLAVVAVRGADAILGEEPGRRRLLAVAAVLGLLGLVTLRTPTGVQHRLYTVQRTKEVPRWTEAGRWLRANAAPGESVACVPVGAVGYYSGLPVIDMVGLTDAHIARVQVDASLAAWAGHEKHDGAYVLSRRPTYLLLNNVDVTDGPRDPRQRPFIPPRSPAVWGREQDVYEAPGFEALYEPRSGRLPDGRALNFYKLREPGAAVGP